MIKYNYFGKEQQICYEKLENGLEVYVIPNNNLDNYHIEVVTKYGSSINEFIPIDSNDYIRLPLGVAHFLEHKMFDMKDSDPFRFYSKTGTYINASTNYFCTKYYIDGKEAFKENFDYLLNMIYTPYFIKEKVDSEKGIIAEEIKMYDDESGWTLDYESKKALFYTTVTDKIAGTTKSIKSITPEVLKCTYNTFYQPSNMFVVATGNVSFDEIINIIKNNKCINSRETNKEITVRKVNEQDIVPLEYKLLEENIVVPKLAYSFKFNLDNLYKDRILTRMYLGLIFTNLFGETSEFNEKVLKDELAIGFYMDHLSFDKTYAFTIEAESEYADLFKDEVDKVLKNIKVSKEDFDRIKKVWISVVIRSLDNKENLAYSISDDIVNDGMVHDQLELINKLKYDELLKIIKRMDLSNKSFILMIPKTNN